MHRPSLEKVDDTVMVELADDLKHGEQLVDSRPDILQSLSQDDMARLEKKLVRKLDIRLLPILILLFILNILDRNAIANARLGGLEEDLGLTQKQYQTAVMAVWAGYISMMIPSNMLLSVIKPRIYLPVCVAVWGLVAGASGFTQNFAGIVVVRFLTGVTEAPYFVGKLQTRTSDDRCMMKAIANAEQAVSSSYLVGTSATSFPSESRSSIPDTPCRRPLAD